ncbi:GntR family transcriptional regulator [Nesterenkonia aurantiaca]|uniref:DNA-binding transcriptional regulator YhcF (GntR family) n=1 Tax=Nesterenkonia aurantiaca TaxID=1436010 RepID=A0A4R7G7R1_9MICC|nr:GntR family transcriptional regulator [Nesterenkonia aurantiaca]TDS87548.1 DNA-binding transcriptional regulator YhcF (GntR family) [Nesterenkonia aurantiaca]
MSSRRGPARGRRWELAHIALPGLVEEGRALFVQIAEQLESSVLDGSLAEGERAPSSNELVSFRRINPARAAKGLNLLVDRGILLKRRGLGMFVAPGAREILPAQHRAQFATDYLDPIITEARTVGLLVDTIIEMLRSRA